MKLLDIIYEQSPDDPITDKEKKKIRAVYTALKTGILEYTHGKPRKVRYVLQDEYDIERGPRTGRPIVVLLGDPENVCRLYEINDDGSIGNYLTIDENQVVYDVLGRRIENRFMKFNVSLIF